MSGLDDDSSASTSSASTTVAPTSTSVPTAHGGDQSQNGLVNNGDSAHSVVEVRPQYRYPRHRSKNFPKIYDDRGELKWPFLVREDIRDVELFRQLNLIDLPPWERLGGLMKAWDDFADHMNSDHIRKPNGEKLYKHPVSGKILRERFLAISKIVKTYEKAAPWMEATEEDLVEQTKTFPGTVRKVLLRHWAWEVHEFKKRGYLVDDEGNKKFLSSSSTTSSTLVAPIAAPMPAPEIRSPVKPTVKPAPRSSIAVDSHALFTPPESSGDIKVSLQRQPARISDISDAAVNSDRKRKSQELSERKLEIEEKKLQLEEKRLKDEIKRRELEEKRLMEEMEYRRKQLEDQRLAREQMMEEQREQRTMFMSIIKMLVEKQTSDSKEK